MPYIMFRFVVLVAFVVFVFGEKIDFHECGKDKSANCGVKEVRLSPCPKVTSSNPCKLRKGLTGTLEFDYEPEFEADELEAHLYWVNAMNIDIPLPGMDTDGCHSTACPTKAGSVNHFAYNLTISKIFPSSKYNVKALLKKDTADECCFEFTIKII